MSNKFSGKLGFISTVESEDRPGVWETQKCEHACRGNIIRGTFNVRNSSDINDNITLNNTLSIVADKFILDNYSRMAYVEMLGAKWKITSAELQHPRITLTIGGIYNG